MGVPHLDESLCGCSVETGSKIIGWFSIAVRVFAMLASIVAYLLVLNDPGKKDPKHDAVFQIVFLITVMTVGIVLVLIIFDVLLLIGVYKRRPSYIFPWIIVQVIAVCVMTLSLLAVFSGTAVFGKLVQTVVSIGVTIYCILIVNSHYKNLKSGATSSYSNN